MTPGLFDQTLRAFVRRKPFIPFVVQSHDGRRILIEEPAVAFGGGEAGILTDQAGLASYRWDQVRDTSLAIPESAS